MRARPLFVALPFLLSACQAQVQGGDRLPEARPLPERVQGANLRAVGDPRRGYGTAKARQTLERLERLGVNTITVFVEARLEDRTATDIVPPSSDEFDAAEAMLRDARALGFATILVPHIVLDDGDWRGHIQSVGPRHDDAWWQNYGRFIEASADLAARSGASVLSLGVELKGLSSSPTTRVRVHHLKNRVRRRFSGLLTYNANWDEAEDVTFWDLVDLVGVNAYYPLAPDPIRGAERVRRRLLKLRQHQQRDILVLEAGFRSSPMSHVEPWAWPRDVPDEVDEGAQARAWAAVLSSWLGTPGIRGLMLWVVPTDPDDPASEPPHGFNPLNKRAEHVIRRAFLSGRST